MPASTEQKVDFLLKKIGYTASKSGIAEDSSLSGTKKAPFAEAIPSPIAIPSTNIWSDSTHIPATPPGSDTAYVKGYRAAASGLRMTVDSSVSGSRAFIAYTTYNNTSTPILGDWIDTQFGSDYIVKVYKGDPNSGGTQLSAAGAGSNDTWFFDYASGVLNFNGTQIPSGVSDTNIYIVAYRYIGAKGSLPPAGIATFSQLYVSGVSTFVGVGTFISDLYVGGNLEVKGTTTFDGGTITLGDAPTDNVVFGADVDSHIIPDDDDTYDLGSNSQQWRNLYVDGIGDIDTLNVIDATFTGGTTVASASTYNGLVDVNNRLDVVGGANVDQLNVTGVSTFNGTITLPGNGGNFRNVNIAVTGANEIDTDSGDLLLDSAGGTVRVDDRLEVIGVSTFSSLVDVNNRLDVVGGANVDQLNVSGVSTTAGLLDINAGAQANTFKVEDLTSGRVVLAGTGGEIEDSGNLTFNGTKLTVTGNAQITTDLDVDGGANIVGGSTLDNLNVTGVTTVAVAIDANGTLDVDGDTQLDDLNVAGVATFSSAVDINSTLDVDGDTQLDDLNVTGVSTFTALVDVNNRLDVVGGANVDQANVSGVSTYGGNVDINANVDVSGTSTLNDDVTFTGASNNAQWDKSENALHFNDNAEATFGNTSGSPDLSIYHNATDSFIKNSTNKLKVLSNKFRFNNAADNKSLIFADDGGSVQLYFDGSKKFSTTGIGVSIHNGIGNTATLAGPSNLIIDPGVVGDDTGSVRIKGDLYVDGTNFTVASGTIELADHVVGIATTSGTNAILDGGGIGIGSDNIRKTFTWNNASAALKSSEHLDIATGKVYKINGDNVLSSDTLGTNILYSSLQTVGVLRGLNVSGVSTFGGNIDANANLDVDGNTTLDNLVVAEAANIVGGATVDQLNVTGVSTYGGNLDINANVDLDGTLDVDGDTQLDDLNVAGVATFSAAIDANSTLDVDGDTQLDDLNVAGVATFSALVDVNNRIDVVGGANIDQANVSGVSTLAQLKMGTVAVTHIRDEDNMSSDSDTSLATQQSIKAYVDSQVTAQDLDVTSDNGTIAIDLDSETLDIAGTANEIETSASGNEVTIGLPNAVTIIDTTISKGLLVSGISTLTDLRIGNANSIDIIRDEDNMASNDVNALATQQSIKAYVDSNITAQDLDFTGDTGSGAIDLDSQTFQVTGTPFEIVTTGSGQVLNVSLPDDVIIGAGLTVTSKLTVGGSATVGITTILDEDNMASDSATALATQQSIKKYVDDRNPAGPGGGNLAVSADSGSNQSINLNTEVLDIEGTSNEIETVTGTNKVIIGLPNAVTILDATISGGLNVTGVSTFTGNMSLLSNTSTFKLGAGSGALSISGDTANGHGYIQHSGAGDFFIRSDTGFNFTRYSGGPHEKYATFNRDGSVDLYFDNVKRFSTSGIGVTITGEAKTTDLNVTGIATLTNLRIGNANNIDVIRDEDNMASNDVNALATQQSIKAYVDAQVTASDLDFQADTGGALSIDLDSEVFGIVGTANEIETAGSGNNVTIGLPNAVTIIDATISGGLGVTGVSTFTGTIDANGLIDADGGANIVGGATIDQANVTGVSTFTGAIDANGALDVDGQTDLDVLNVAETATFSALIDANARLDVAGGANVDQVNVTGVSTYAGTAKFDGLVDVNNRLDVVGGANIDQANVSGISTLAQLKMGSITATSILDEDNMASDSAAALATQQSIKAYVDSQVTAQDLDFQADSGGALAIDLDSEVLTIAGTSNEIETAGSGNQVTIGLPNAVTILDATISGGLNVSGVTTTTNLQVGAAGTTITTQNTTSRVGINSTVPAYTLDVGGIINSSTDVRINGVSVVDQALNDAVAMAIALG